MKRFAIFCLFTLILTSAQGAVIQLSNGDQINAEILMRTDTSVTVSHPVLGDIAIPTRQITSIDGKVFAATPKAPDTQQAIVAPREGDQQTIKTVATTEPAETKEIKKIDEESGLFGFDINFRPLRGWEHRLGGGFNGKQGNTNTTTAHVEYRGTFEDKLKRWNLRSIYDYNAGDENDALNEYYFQVTRDWLKPGSPWFYFADGKYEWDEYKVWDHRITGIAGTGYEFIKRRDLLVLGRLGLAGQQTVGGSDPGFTPEFMFGGDIDKTFSEIHSLKLKTAFFQDLQDSNSFRNISNLDWDIVLNRLWGLGLSIGLENEYESEPDPGDEDNDFKYKLSFVWAWGGKEQP